MSRAGWVVVAVAWYALCCALWIPIIFMPPLNMALIPALFFMALGGGGVIANNIEKAKKRETPGWEQRQARAAESYQQLLKAGWRPIDEASMVLAPPDTADDTVRAA